MKKKKKKLKNNMTNEEILKKAIEKAIKNGFNFSGERDDQECFTIDLWLDTHMDMYYSLIFDHGFAKAFWKDEESPKLCAGNHLGEAWQYHLQEIVLEEEPLKYLKKFL